MRARILRARCFLLFKQPNREELYKASDIWTTASRESRKLESGAAKRVLNLYTVRAVACIIKAQRPSGG